MLITFIIKAPPYSINQAYYRNGGTKEEYRYWRDGVRMELDKPSVTQLLNLFKGQFDPLEHQIGVRYKFVYPEKKLYTKMGAIHKRSKDLSNIEKLLQDAVFKKLELDDAFITELHSIKASHTKDEYEIEISLWTIDHPI